MFELSASDTNVSILSRDSRQPIIAKQPAKGRVFKHVRCSDLSNGMNEKNKIDIQKICEVRKLIRSLDFTNKICRLNFGLQKK